MLIASSNNADYLFKTVFTSSNPNINNLCGFLAIAEPPPDPVRWPRTSSAWNNR
jgi:hypothetical protein